MIMPHRSSLPRTSTCIKTGDRVVSRFTQKHRIPITPHNNIEHDVTPSPWILKGVFLPLCKVADTPFHIQGDDVMTGQDATMFHEIFVVALSTTHHGWHWSHGGCI